jgi:hypothetical protein
LQCHKSFYVTAVLIGSCLTWEKLSPHNQKLIAPL